MCILLLGVRRYIKLSRCVCNIRKALRAVMMYGTSADDIIDQLLSMPDTTVKVPATIEPEPELALQKRASIGNGSRWSVVTIPR